MKHYAAASQYGIEKVIRFQGGMHQNRHQRPVLQSLEQMDDHTRLSQTGRGNQRSKAAAFHERAVQGGSCLGVLRRSEKVSGIGADAERFIGQPKKLLIHVRIWPLRRWEPN